MAYVGGTEIIASFRIGGGGVSSVNGLTGVVTLAAGTNVTIVPTGNTLTINAFGTIGGSIAATQVAFGSGANTITGTNNFEFVDSAGTQKLGFGPGGIGLGFAIGIMVTDSTGKISLQGNDGSGSGIVQLVAGGIPLVIANNAAGITNVTIGNGAANAGNFVFTQDGKETIFGSTSGSAAIGVAAVAGTPNRINLPIATGAAGTFLQTDGGNPQQTSWVALTGTTLVASGTATLNTAAIPAVTAATVVTVAGAGILTTDSIEWAFSATPGTGYTTGLHVLAFVSSGNVNFSVVNPTAGALTPAAATLNWRVIR